MQKLNPDLRNFLTGAIGYLAGAAAGFLFVFLVARLGVVGWIFGLIDQNQTLVQILAIPVIAGFMLALGGAVMGGVGGWALTRILGTSKRLRLATGSGIALAVNVGVLLFIFLLLASLLALYNNLTTNRIEQYGIIFGIFGLVFGLLTGLLLAFMTVRLRYTWRVILSATLGFALGGLLMGILVRLVNPSQGYQSFPILRTLVLLLALALPFALGGGALGFTYGRIGRRVTAADQPVESLQSPWWQVAIVAVIGLVLTSGFFSTLDQIANFLVINPANMQSQIGPKTIGVQWSEPQALDGILALDAPQTVLAAGENGPAAVVYVQADDGEADIYLQTTLLDENGSFTGWSEAVNISNTADIASSQPQIASDAQGNLTVTWIEGDSSSNAVIYLSSCTQNVCAAPQPVSGLEALAAAGLVPVAVTGPDQIQHLAWCSAEGVINYLQEDGQIEQITLPGCSSSPGIALDADNNPHLVWYTEEIRDTNGVERLASVLVESIRMQNGWSEAAIAARTEGATSPYLTSDDEGNLHLVWRDPQLESSALFYALQENYQCSAEQLSPVALAGLERIRSDGSRPPGSEIPYCRNQFRRILYTPNPEPQYSDDSPTPNSAFDRVSANALQTEYELLFSTMQWEPNTDPPSPGSVLAAAVGDLYRQVKANPQDYPRGMTVRILLGNYPVMSNFQWGAQIIDAITDLRAAGVEKMVDPEIGWRLEVANFAGTYPHSHTKFIVEDGNLLAGAGFNYGYLHYPKDHPSGKGYDLFDLGMIVIGPIAQEALSEYDDMWTDADQIHCEDLSLPDGEWQQTCQQRKATSDHVPEVLRTYLPPEGDSNAFSLYRTKEYKEADDFTVAALTASSSSIDVMQANFSLDIHCMAQIVIPDLCSLDDTLPFMDAILAAVEQNNTRVRVLMENTNTYGLENRVTWMVIKPELERLGLVDHVELRFFNGKVHAKSILIDDQLLIIGSQNMHYSAWGEGGLNEYMLTTDDPRAIAEYQALFETKWQAAIPVEEAEYGTSP